MIKESFSTAGRKREWLPCSLEVACKGQHALRVDVSKFADTVRKNYELALVSLQIKETVDAEGWCTKGRYS